MADAANGDGAKIGDKDSPLEMAKQMTATMCHQPKEAYWLGVQMENSLRAYQPVENFVG